MANIQASKLARRQEGHMITADVNEEIVRLQSLPEEHQESAARSYFDNLLASVSPSQNEPISNCGKLCYFIEQCSRSTELNLKNVAFSEITCLQLLEFYLEWNEKRMLKVLEVIQKLIKTFPSGNGKVICQMKMIQRLISIIMHDIDEPLVKPALKAAEYLIEKEVVSIGDVCEYLSSRKPTYLGQTDKRDYSLVTKAFVSEVFSWMTLPDTSPSMGNLLVAIHQKLKKELGNMPSSVSEPQWQDWIQHGLQNYPESLENVKNHLFTELFKKERDESLKFLRSLIKASSGASIDVGARDSQMSIEGDEESINHRLASKTHNIPNSSAHDLLLISALEVGKKKGLVVGRDDLDDSCLTTPLELENGSFVRLPRAIISTMLKNTSSQIRSSAFTVLISSSESTRPFSASTLVILRDRLHVLHADTDAKFRNEVSSNTKHMIERLQNSRNRLLRDIRAVAKKLDDDDWTTHSLNQTRSRTLLEQDRFVVWYYNFLCAELIPTASYQRHITSLTSLRMLALSGIITDIRTLENSKQQISNPSFFHGPILRLLLDLLIDPFDDVRAMSASILQIATLDDFRQPSNISNIASHHSSSFEGTSLAEIIQWIPSSPLRDIIALAESYSTRTGRADYSDGLARALALQYRLIPSDAKRIVFIKMLIAELEARLNIAVRSLPLAVKDSPLHGIFASLRYIWESSSTASKEIASLEDQKSILDCAVRLWDTVKHILCDDSPEGRLLSDEDEDDTLDTKTVLSYSWRATHESSNLLRAMVKTTEKTLPMDSQMREPVDLVLSIGELTFDQLSTLRHRGAFSTVSLTFTRCCQITQVEGTLRSSLDSHLLDWYQPLEDFRGSTFCWICTNSKKRTLKRINEQTSTTRRSAGVPALITGILSADADNPSFMAVMENLLAIASQPAPRTLTDDINFPQVHAMNSLREIFKSSILGSKAEVFTTTCLNLAANSLQSEVWAIRNCGLILLRSLIDSLFGTNEGKAVAEAGWDGRSVRLPYDRYPALPTLLLELLNRNALKTVNGQIPVISSVESVFPALDIIRRAGPPPELRDQMYKSVSIHLESRVWHIRDLAARTMVSFLLHDSWLPDVMLLLENCNTANRQHGVLTAITHFLERMLEDEKETHIGRTITKLKDLALAVELFRETNLQSQKSQEVQASYEGLVNTILKVALATSRRMRSMAVRTNSIRLESFQISSYEMETLVMRVKNLLDNSLLQNGTYYETSALLRRNIVLQLLYTATLSGDVRPLQSMISECIRIDVDTSLVLLEELPLVWKTRQSTAEELVKLGMIYSQCIPLTIDATIHQALFENLIDLLDQLADLNALDNHSRRLVEIHGVMGGKKGWERSPEFSNGQILISGYVMLFALLEHDLKETTMRDLAAWGDMLAYTGIDTNDFNMRYAAAKALANFYNNSGMTRMKSLEHPAFLSSLMALYNTLNDDDEEIRDLGAIVVSNLLGFQCVPLVAAKELLFWVMKNPELKRALSSVALQRITLSVPDCCAVNRDQHHPFFLCDVGEQLSSAYKQKDGNALFMEEKQNLYIDEVREIILWSAIIEAGEEVLVEEREVLPGPPDLLGVYAGYCERSSIPETEKPRLVGLHDWVVSGLKNLIIYAETFSLFGKTSKPEVFTIFMSVVLSLKALIGRYQRYGFEKDNTTELELEELVRRLLTSAGIADVHPILLQTLHRFRLDKSISNVSNHLASVIEGNLLQQPPSSPEKHHISSTLNI